MALLLREIALELGTEESALPGKLCKFLDILPSELQSWRIVRRGIDARHKPRILRIYTVEFSVADEEGLLARRQELRTLERAAPPAPPVVVPLVFRPEVVVAGMGPAGLFAALHLARCGCAVTLLERGRPVEERVRDVRRFWDEGSLDPESNVQFGEGGAGTFSDGKLTTRLNHPWTSFVLQTLVECGAPPEILVQAKPHVGSDRLRLILINLRRRLESLGVVLRYRCRLDGLLTVSGGIRGALLNGGEEILCSSLVLAPGHSARDTYEMLQRTGVRLDVKPFAVGVRVEHPSELINRIQYGLPGHPQLPTAEYALTYNDPQSGRGIYSFCMCPGGEVVLASSEAGGVTVNGMSLRRRDGRYSNSALVVAVRPADFDGRDPLAGVRFQRRLERAAFAAAGSDYHAPAQNLLAFLGRGDGPLVSSCRPGVRAVDLGALLPPFVNEGLRRALPVFERRMRGFITREATLVGVETRTSAPLRIVRGEDGQSISHPGLYPAGEGAGYAGGIMSAALDGLRVAEHIVSKERNRSLV